MTIAFMNAFCEAFGHAQNKPRLYPTPRVMHWHFSIVLCLNYGNVTDGLLYNHVSASVEDPRGGQSEIDWDLKGKSRGYDMACLQTVLCHIRQVWYCLVGREKCF